MSNDKEKSQEAPKQKPAPKSDELDLESLENVAGGMASAIPGGGSGPDAPGGGCISQS